MSWRLNIVENQQESGVEWKHVSVFGTGLSVGALLLYLLGRGHGLVLSK
jgi:hypothetical protein